LNVEVDGQVLHLTHLNKIYFPESGIRKRDLLAYYFRIGHLMLPFLKNRPLVLRRYPNGIEEKAFFQKEAPDSIPEWIQRATVYSEDRGGAMPYVMAQNLASLLFLTNLGCIDHNPWSSCGNTQDSPDYVFFDLSTVDIQEYYSGGKLGTKDHEEMERLVRSELSASFRPEFLNRVDDIIIFHSLDEKQLLHVVDIQLERLEKRLTQQQLTLDVDRSAKQLIAKEGFDPQFGARPLKRAIQDLLLDPLATKLLVGEFKPGDRIKVLAHNGELEFEKK